MFKRGVACQNICMSLPSILVERKDVGFERCLMIQCCPFYGLEFSLMWVGKITSYKHVCHCWCVSIHFSTSSKCIQPSCREDMHETWWKSSGMNKLGTIVILDHAPCKDFGSRPEFLPLQKPKTKGTINSVLLSSFVVIEFC